MKNVQPSAMTISGSGFGEIKQIFKTKTTTWVIWFFVWENQIGWKSEELCSAYVLGALEGENILISRGKAFPQWNAYCWREIIPREEFHELWNFAQEKLNERLG